MTRKSNAAGRIICAEENHDLFLCATGAEVDCREQVRCTTGTAIGVGGTKAGALGCTGDTLGPRGRGQAGGTCIVVGVLVGGIGVHCVGCTLGDGPGNPEIVAGMDAGGVGDGLAGFTLGDGPGNSRTVVGVVVGGAGVHCSGVTLGDEPGLAALINGRGASDLGDVLVAPGASTGSSEKRQSFGPDCSRQSCRRTFLSGDKRVTAIFVKTMLQSQSQNFLMPNRL